MRQAPMNYLITIALGVFLWVATAVFAGQQLGDAVVLQKLTTSQFVQTYQNVVAGATVFGILGCVYWYFYGSRSAVTGRLADARRTWTLLLVGEAVVAALALVVLIVLFTGESLTGGNFAEMLVLLLVPTALLFWGCSLVFSPRAVEYIPWGKR